MKGPGSSLTWEPLLSRTTPTISVSGLSSGPPIPIRWPMACLPGSTFFAKVSLTTQTLGAFASSAQVIARPSSSGMPSVTK